MTEPTPPQTSRTSRLVVAAAVVVGLVAGLGGAFLLGRSSGDQADPTAVTSTTTADGDPEAFADLPEPDAVGDPASATDPEAAIRGFLAAEVAGEWETSYEFLAPAQREVAFPSAALWVNQHASTPTVTGYRIDDVEVDEDAGTAAVTTLTGFEATLDPVLGLVPARGRTTWVLVRDEDGRWRVDPSATTYRPLFPGSDGAAEAVRAWVDARVACEDTTDLESGLVGSPALARQLCEEDQPDEVAIGPVGPLTDSADSAALLSQFGPEVFGWARTARVAGATPLTAVLAPIGQRWRVVGVIPG